LDVLLSVVALVVLVSWVVLWVGLLGSAVGAAPTVLTAAAVQRWVRRRRSTETMGRHRAAGPPVRWPVVVVAAAGSVRQWLGLVAADRSTSTATGSRIGRDDAAAD
jgi:hypothetical protein